jgi:phosphatidate cytidylyltransferase
MNPAVPGPVRFADLGRRLGSGLILAAIALADLWAGGVWAVAFVALVLVLMLWELHRMVTGDDRRTAPALAALAVAGAAAVVAAGAVGAPAAFACLALGGMLAIVLDQRWGGWLAAGLVYMGAAMCALIVFRARGLEGALVILWLVLIVVAADVGAYFVGRTLGGPRLWRRVSPGKTWAGAIGGLAFAGIAGIGFGLAAGWDAGRLALLSLGVGVASQLGDLLESAVKRRFGVKDASRLIPGHGGVMDRLDGVMGGVLFFAACEMLGLGALGR